ncbi:MAG: GSU2204 family outer membrane beta-barrel protein, partial [Candidatus Zixiibacteriota bacterium]
MRLLTKALSVGLLLLAAPALFAQDSTTEKYTLWFGGHYTDFTDYRKKVGEYNLDEENVWPEFTINYLSKSKEGTFVLDGHFYDDKNIRGKVSTVVGERLNGTFEYRSLIHQLGQDKLANLETREWLGTAPGGKILTHELFDEGADYNIHRQEILSNLAVLLSRR